jgi:hypothetical protein
MVRACRDQPRYGSSRYGSSPVRIVPVPGDHHDAGAELGAELIAGDAQVHACLLVRPEVLPPTQSVLGFWACRDVGAASGSGGVVRSASMRTARAKVVKGKVVTRA